MQAFDKINELDNKISALTSASMRLDNHDQSREIRIIKEIEDEFVKERKQLQEQLERTQLSNIR